MLSVGFAQQYELIDSMKNELKTATGDKYKSLLYDLAWEYRKSHPDSTLYYCRKIISIIQNEHEPSCLAECYNYMGIAYHYMGDDVQAYDFYNLAIESSIDASDSVQYGHSLNNMGRMFLYQGDFVKAYDHVHQALNVFSDIHDESGMSYAFKSLSELYQTQKKYDEALTMSRHTLDIRRQSRNIGGEISVLNEMAMIFQASGNLDSALFYFEQAEDKAVFIKDAISLSRIYVGLSQLHRKKGEYQLALEEALNARKIVSASENMSLTHEINLELAQIYFALEELPKARELALEVIEDSERSGNLNLDEEAYFILANIEERFGNYKAALENFREYSRIQANLNDVQAARMIERLEARLEIESKQKENEILLAAQQVDQALIDRQRLQNILLTVAVLTALVFLITLYVINSRRRKTNARLREKNVQIARQKEEIKSQHEKIAEQNAKLKKRNDKLATINNEKDTLMNILAHDLKAPFNRVHGIGHLLQMSESKEETENYMRMLFGAADNGLNLIRDLLEVSAHQGGKSLNIDKLDVKEVIEEKIDMFRSEARSKDITLKVDSEESVILMSDKPYIGRILDNLISNAIKFSNPSATVVVSAGKEKGGVFISVSDQGPGFTDDDKKLLYRKFSKLSARPTAGESSNGLGLAIVKLLVESLEGEIELKTQLGEGSTFIIHFPSRVDERVKQS
jgi:signal transduction histidine kinase